MKLDITVKFSSGGSINLEWDSQLLGNSDELILFDSILSKIREFARRETVDLLVPSPAAETQP